MRKNPAIVLLAATFIGACMAKGSGRRHVEAGSRSSISPRTCAEEPTRGTPIRDGLALDGKNVGADGKEASMHVAYRPTARYLLPATQTPTA